MKYILLAAVLTSALPAQSQGFENVILLDNWHNDSIPTIYQEMRYNEVWGFVQNGEEYGVIGSTLGTHIFRLTADDQLEEVDFVPGAFQGQVIHRDYHDYEGYLYGVCDQGQSTLQIMDLQYLPDSVSLVYNSNEFVTTAHNVFIDSASAKLYLAGPAPTALRILSVENPTQPEYASDFFTVFYVHDLFVRNDSAFLNCANEGLMVVDFSEPLSPQQLGSLDTYPDQGYNHSGWLSENGNTYVFADETDGMRMKVCDVSDLGSIEVEGLFSSGVSENSVVHNLQMINDTVYVSHYNDGLQVFDVSNPEEPERIAWYDTFSGDESYAFNGAWGVYAFLPSRRILISDRTSGLYLFKLDEPTGISAQPEKPTVRVYPNPTHGEVTIETDANDVNAVVLYNFSGQMVAQFGVGDWHPGGSLVFDWSDLPAGMYVVEIKGKESVSETKLMKF